MKQVHTRLLNFAGKLSNRNKQFVKHPDCNSLTGFNGRLHPQASSKLQWWGWNKAKIFLIHCFTKWNHSEAWQVPCLKEFPGMDLKFFWTVSVRQFGRTLVSFLFFFNKGISAVEIYIRIYQIIWIV